MYDEYGNYRHREKGLTELVMSFIYDKAKEGFKYPWRGCAYLALLFMAWTLWPTANYRAQIFPVRDIRTPADRINADTAYAEINTIRKRIVNLSADNKYGSEEAFPDRMRLIWLDRRVNDHQFTTLVGQTVRLQESTLEQYRNPSGGANGEAHLNRLHSMMNGPDFTAIARWESTVNEFAGFQVLLESLAGYWWSLRYQILLIGMLYNLLTMRDRKLRIRYQVTAGFPLFFLASAFPQIGVWVYPTRDRAREAVYLLRCAVYLIAFGLVTLCGGIAKAQTTDTGAKKEARCELGITPAIDPPPPDKKLPTLTVFAFGDVTGNSSHDRQAVFTFTASNGLTILQQNRQTSDRTATTGNITFGWTLWPHRNFDFTATTGPAFNYAVRGQQSGYNHQVVVFLISNWRTQFFQFSSLVKLMAPTDKKVTFGDRHIQTIRGPTDRTPRILRGIALQMENWHVNGPKGGHWVESMIGPILNIGEILGKSRSPLAWFSVYPYKDLCRPQPNHSRLWDIRIQFKRTFALAN